MCLTKQSQNLYKPDDGCQHLVNILKGVHKQGEVKLYRHEKCVVTVFTELRDLVLLFFVCKLSTCQFFPNNFMNNKKVNLLT